MTLLISKTKFFEDMVWMSNPILGEYIQNQNFIDQYQLVMKILGDTEIGSEVTLNYPERFFPNNLSQLFWTKVQEYMRKGVRFYVKTSDLTAATFIWKEWETRQIEVPGKGIFTLTHCYGRNVSDVMSVHTF
jgi:hypothetical protein